MAYNAPHIPLQAPEELIDRYRAMGGLTEEVCRLYAMIEAMDTGIGNILDRLEQHGLSDNTIVIFSSDNGPKNNGPMQRYNGPFSGGKGSVLEGGIRVPAIARWPERIPAGSQSDLLVHFCDWLPTLASMAGVEVPSDLKLDGYDATCRLKGESGEIPDIRFWQRNRYEPVTHSNAAMRDGNWKLLWPTRPGADGKDYIADSGAYLHGLKGGAHWLMDVDSSLPERDIGPEVEPKLFDITHDPGEEHDLADQHPDLVSDMRRQWDQWFDDVCKDYREARKENLKLDE